MRRLSRLTLFLLVATLSAQCEVCGDYDGDGDVDILDVLRIGQAANGSITPTPAQLVCGDVDGDGVLSVLDALLVGQLVSGLEVETACHGALLLYEDCASTFAIMPRARQALVDAINAQGFAVDESETLPAYLDAYRFIVDLRFTTGLHAGERRRWRDFVDRNLRPGDVLRLFLLSAIHRLRAWSSSLVALNSSALASRSRPSSRSRCATSRFTTGSALEPACWSAASAWATACAPCWNC